MSGRALMFSHRNVKVLNKDTAIWEEEDYCTPPLKEEKENVLDKFFDEIKVEKVSKGEG